MRIEEIGGVTIVEGDSLGSLRLLDDRSVNCCVTSPPYWGLRDYGVSGQLGLESTPQEYVEKMVTVFREVRRVLRDDGTLWLNLGDSYSRAQESNVPQTKKGTVPAYPAHTKEGSSDGAVGRADRPGSRAATLAPKNLIGIPWRVAFALQADGWYLRQDIIWAKPNPMPESVRDRCTKSHEYIFLLSKQEKYYYDCDAIKEPSIVPAGKGGHQRFGAPGGKAEISYGAMVSGEIWHGNGMRNKRSVWTVTTKPFKAAHFATFPPDLIEPCVLAGCPVSGVVLDPFSGAGTTGLVAQRHGRQAILLELNPKYVDLTLSRLTTAILKSP